MGQGIQHSTFYGYDNVFPLRHPEWDDMRIAIGNVTLPSVQKPTWTDFKGGKVLAFADQANLANEERVFFVAQLPHSYKEGTDLYAHIHWIGEDNTAADVAWQLSYSWQSFTDAFPAETNVVAIAANNLTIDAHNISELATLDGTGQRISSMLICSLRRNSSNAADTFTGKDAYLLELDFHFAMDTLGSLEIGTKN
jgi:hypothetical protein